MIKYLYFILSFVIVVSIIEGIPAIDIFSHSWHIIARWTVCIVAFLSVFGTILVLVGYADEHDSPKSDFGQFFLRTTVGQTFLPKWPVIVWLVLSAVLIQFNQMGLACSVFLMTLFAGSFVYVHNGFYTTFLKEEAKGE